MSFVSRLLTAKFDLASGSFGDTGANSAKVSGLRMSAFLRNAGGPSDGTMDLVVYGLTASMMNSLSTLGMQVNLVPKNAVTLTAGDAESGQATVFAGYILAAYADYQAMPQVAFRITAHTGLPQAVIPADATSFQGSADVATIMSGLASSMGLQFENSGVSGKLSNPYFSGSYKAQMQACAEAAGINAVIVNGKLCIWPKNGARDGEIPLISPQTGLVGYPAYTAYGLHLTTLYNPSIGFGQKVKVESSVKPANGTWAVYRLDHELECLVPGGGKWFSEVSVYNPSYPTPVL